MSMGVILRDNRLLLNGEKVLLFSGEMHFWRIAPEYWEKCLSQLKKAGLEIVSTYVSWRRHSISSEENDLTGKTDPRLNLPRFLQLCAKLEIWVHLKPGPWICAEEQNGGYPEWLLEKEKILVRDSQGSLVKGYGSPLSHYVPSYLHPQYLFYARKWITDVGLCIKDFCYPKGPIILIQIDNEPSMAFHDQMFASDYNQINIGLYQKWLEEKYFSIEKLNSVCGTSYAQFSAIELPFKLAVTHLQDLKKYMDWVEFKEWLLTRHLTLLKEMHLDNGINEVLFTTNYNHHRPMAVPNNWRKLEEATGLGGYDIYALAPLDDGAFTDMVKAINYARAVSRMPWAPEIMSGVWNIKGAKDTPTVSREHLEFLYFIALAYGLKGMNFYMFVNRENWANAPVTEEGEKTYTYQAVSKVMRFIKEVKDFDSLTKTQSIALMYYRPYAWEKYACAEKEIWLEDNLLGISYEQFENLHKSLLQLNYDPAIFDPLIEKESIFRYRLVFVPASLYMDEESQAILKEYVNKGRTIVFLPFVPQLNLKMEKFSDFGIEMGMREKLLSEQEFSTPWGKVLADKFVSYSKKGDCFREQRLGKGKIIFLGACLYEGENEQKRRINNDFLQSFLTQCKVNPEIETNDSYVNTVVQRNKLQQILFVINREKKSRKVHLKFSQIKCGQFQDVFSPEEMFSIKKSETSVPVEATSVGVFQFKRYLTE